jgi:hypothetical protein
LPLCFALPFGEHAYNLWTACGLAVAISPEPSCQIANSFPIHLYALIIGGRLNGFDLGDNP